MATSIIKVYDLSYSQWKKDARVALGWDGCTSLGTSDKVYTNNDGIAIIDHSATGEATIYVDGKIVGKMDTPGSATVEIKIILKLSDL